jgi:SAM-dependent methyltransferase
MEEYMTLEDILINGITQHITETTTMLDIGCGNKKYSSICKNTTTLDAWEKVNPDVLLDAAKNPLPFDNKSFDVILLLDVIEHMEKEEGKRLLEECKRVSSKIFLFTPLWWDDNSRHVHDKNLWCYGNPYNYHLSLWTEEDFKDWNLIQLIPAEGPDRLAYYGYWEE